MEDGDLRLPPESMHVKPGDSVGVEVTPDGIIMLFPKTLKSRDVCGCLKPYTSVKASVEEMDEAVAEAFRRGEL
jgi:hypothetical protein